MRTNIKTLMLILIVLFSCIKVSSADKLNYYVNLFAPLGLDIKTIIDTDYIKTLSGISAESTPSSDYNFEFLPEKNMGLKDSKNQYVMTTSSLLNHNKKLSEELISHHSKLIIICDTPIKTNSFYCDQISFRSEIARTTQLGNTPSESVGYAEINSYSVFLVPESYLLSPTSLEKVKEYFRAVISVEAPVPANPADTVVKLTLIEQLNLFLKSKQFLLIYLIIAITLIYLLANEALNLLKRLKSFAINPKTTKILFSIWEKYKIFNGFVLLLALGLVVLYVIFLVYIFHKASITNPLAIVALYFKNFYPETILEALKLRDKKSMVMLGVSLCSGFLFVLFLLPSLLNYLKSIKMLINRGNIRERALTPLFLILLFFVTALILYVPSGIKSPLVMLLCLLLLFILLTIPSKKFTPIGILNRFFILGLFYLLILGSFLKKEKNEVVTVRNLFNEQTKIFMLPYQQRFPNGTQFTRFFVKVSSKLWVNNHLVFHPEYPIIKNSSIENFSAEGSYIVLNDSVDNVFKQLSTNSLLMSQFKIINNSPQVYIKKYSVSDNSKYKIQIDVDCASEVRSQNFGIDLYYAGTKKVIDDFVFPGCGNDPSFPSFIVTNSTETFILEKSLDIYHNGSVVAYGASPKGKVRNIIFSTADNPEGNSVNFEYDMKNPILFYADGKEPYITNYAFSLISSATYKNVNYFDLGSLVNELSKSGVIGNTVRIWTDDKDYVVLVNRFLEPTL